MNKVIVDEADDRMELVVPDEKLSLAIGRKGQNVRLASQLTGWKLDIISESQVQADGGGGDRRARARSTASTSELAKAHVPPRLPRARRGRRGRARGARGIEGVENEERAEELKKAAERALERLRQDRIRRVVEQGGSVGEREALLLIPGMGTRTAQALEDSGYKSVRDVSREDPDRLSIKSGLGHKKARQIWQGAVEFQRTVAKEIQDARERMAEQRAELEAEAEAAIAAAAPLVAASAPQAEASEES